MSRLVVLDELRGVAITFVLLCHIGLIWTGAPWADALNQLALGVGVDLFFVISGFVISRNLAEIRTGDFSSTARAFWLRRFCRIALPAWAVVAAVGAVDLATGSRSATIGDLAAAAAFYADVHWGRCFGGAGSCGDVLVTSHFWSLALEMQFYFLAPFLAALPRRVTAGVVVAVLCAGAVVSRPWGGLLWALRVDSLLIGVWLAAEAARGASWLERFPRVSLGLSVYWVAVAAVLGRIFAIGPGGVGLVLIAIVVGFVIAGRLRATPATSAAGRGVRKIGELSFSLYLVHMPVLFAVHAWVRTSPALALAVALPAVAGATLILEKLVTRPAQGIGRALAARAGSGLEPFGLSNGTENHGYTRARFQRNRVIPNGRKAASLLSRGHLDRQLWRGNRDTPRL